MSQMASADLLCCAAVSDCGPLQRNLIRLRETAICLVALLVGMIGWGASAVQAQVILPIPSKSAIPATDNSPESGEVATPTDDNPEATAVETTGTIEISPQVTDDEVRERLRKLLPQYPGVRSIEVDVDEGVVTLRGHVENDLIRDRLRDFVRRVQGVKIGRAHV